MRTNIDIDIDIDIDEALMDQALQACPFKPRKDAVDAGLKQLARQAASRAVAQWRGMLKWASDGSVDGAAANRADAGVAAQALDGMLQHGQVRIVVPDLVLFKVLRGFRHERDHRRARALLESFDIEDVGGAALTRQTAGHHRDLRAHGGTVRSGIDVRVASFCIEHDDALLHRHRDFQAFEQRRGLRGWAH